MRKREKQPRRATGTRATAGLYRRGAARRESGGGRDEGVASRILPREKPRSFVASRRAVLDAPSGPTFRVDSSTWSFHARITEGLRFPEGQRVAFSLIDSALWFAARGAIAR